MSGPKFSFLAKLKRPNVGADPSKYLQNEMCQNLKAIEDMMKNAVGKSELSASSDKNFVITNDCGVFAVPVAFSLSPVTNLSANITIKKNPVLVQIVLSDNNGLNMEMGGGAGFVVGMFRNSTQKQLILIDATGPKGPLTWFDNPGPGTYTYSIKAGITLVVGGQIRFGRLLVTEM